MLTALILSRQDNRIQGGSYSLEISTWRSIERNGKRTIFFRSPWLKGLSALRFDAGLLKAGKFASTKKRGRGLLREA